MKILYLDTETTGLDPNKHSIIQLAGTIYNSEKDQSEEFFDYKIAPYTDEPWGTGAYETHSITPEVAASYPDQREAFLEFKKLLASHVNAYDKTDKLYICGYNVKFDIDFVSSWFKLNQDKYFYSWFYYPPLDVMQLAAWNLVGKRQLLENFRLATVYKHFAGKDFDNAHNAASDVAATREIASLIFKAQMKTTN